MLQALAAREAGNLYIRQTVSTRTQSRKAQPRKVLQTAGSQTLHRRDMWSVDKAINHNWIVFIFCGSTQTLGFLPT